MKVLFDTNIILDVLLDRMPFSDASSELMAQVEEGALQGFLAATTLTTIFFLCKKYKNAMFAEKSLEKLLRLFEIAPINRMILEEALELKFNDFEDAVLSTSAKHVGVDVIATRNLKDFKHSSLPAFSPDQLLKSFKILNPPSA